MRDYWKRSRIFIVSVSCDSGLCPYSTLRLRLPYLPLANTEGGAVALGREFPVFIFSFMVWAFFLTNTTVTVSAILSYFGLVIRFSLFIEIYNQIGL